MKRSRRLMIIILCFSLFGICILPNLSVHAATAQDSLADAIDDCNALSPSMSDRSYGLELKTILDNDRLFTHYGDKPADLALLNTVRDEIDPYVSEISVLIRNISSPEQSSLQTKTDLLGLTLKGLYTGTLAWIYNSNVDATLKSISLTVSVEFGSNYQITTTEMTVGAYYEYLRDDAIGGKSNEYFTKTQPDAVYRYFTWLFRAIYEAKLSLLTPTAQQSPVQQENIREILAGALTDIKNCSYQSGVEAETSDGLRLTDGEDGYNFRQIYERTRLAIGFSDLYALLCPDQTLAQSEATKDLISSLSSAVHNSRINECVERMLDGVLMELQGANTAGNSHAYAYFQSLREQCAEIFREANETNRLVNASDLSVPFAKHEFLLTQARAKDELFKTLSTLLKNTERYPGNSPQKTALTEIADTAASAIDACEDPSSLDLEIVRGNTRMTLYDEYRAALAEGKLPYLTKDEILLLTNSLLSLHDLHSSAIQEAEDPTAIEAALAAFRDGTRALLSEAAKTSLTKKKATVHADVKGYDFLDTEQKEACFAQLEEVTENSLLALSSATDTASVLSIRKQTSSELDRIHTDAAKKEYEAAAVRARNRRDEYSDEQYERLLDILDQADQALKESASAKDYLSEKAKMLDDIALLPTLLDEAFEEISASKNRYSDESWSLLESIYNQAKSNLANPPEGTTAVSLIQSGILEMKSIRARILYTPDGQLANDRPADYREGDDYYGSISAPNGLPSNGILTVEPIGKDSGDSVAKRIMQAAKDGRITDRNGNALSKDLIRLLKNSSVPVGFDVSFTPAEDGTSYSLSVLLPKGISLDHAIGVVLLLEDGSAQYYEITNEGQLIHFETDRLATYYVVSANVVNLLPVILILTAVLIAEIVVLSIMYVKRSRKRRAPITIPAMALVPPYFPENGWITIILLSIAIVLLGGWIASIPILEKIAAKKVSRPAPEPKEEIKEEEPCEEQTEAPRELPEAEAILSLPKAKERPSLPEADAVPALPEAEAVPILQGAEPILSLPPASEPIFIDLEEYTGNRKGEINLDTLCAHFEEGEQITLNDMKRKKLISKQVGSVKVLGRGQLGKSLTVIAQDFSAEAREKLEAQGGYAIVTHPSPKCAERSS